MEEKTNNEPQNALEDSLRALSRGQGGLLESALADFLNGEGTLTEATRAASAEGGKEIAALVKFLVDQFNISPTVATIIATLLIKIAPSIGKTAPKKRRTPSKKKPAAKKSTAKKTKPKKKPATKKTTEPKKPAAKKKPPAKKKPASTAKKRKPARKKTRAVVIGELGESP